VKRGQESPFLTPQWQERKLSRAAVLLPWMAAALLMIGTGLGISVIRNAADDRREGQVELARLEAYTNEQLAVISEVTTLSTIIEDESRPVFKADLEDLPGEMTRLETRLERSMERIANLGLPDEELATLRVRFRQYEDSIEAQAGILQRGDFDQAWIYERSKTRPVYDRLREAAQASVTTNGKLAEQANRFASFGTFAVLALAGLALALGRAHNERQRRSFQKRITHQAFHDPLTDLANRLLLRERLDHALSLAKRRSDTLCVMFIDLDGFKHVNDTMGHDAGDLLLREVSNRLSYCVRDSDTIARLGGDEFAVLMEMTTPAQAQLVAERSLVSLQKPIVLSGGTVELTGSIGISTCEDGGSTVEEMLANADLAMYAAKAGGKNCYRVFREGMRQMLLQRIDLEGDLKKAIENDEFAVYFQPLVNLETREVVGVETLARWHHPEKGLMAADQFIPVAEDSGIIVQLDAYVLEAACRELVKFVEADMPLAELVSVNVSAKAFARGDFVEVVGRAVERSGLAASRLMVEITEGSLMHDTQSTLDKLHRLRAMGIRIAVDDFGTGYSSLSYLRRFPVDVVKIDRSFVQHISEGPDEGAIAAAIIKLCESLGLEVIAEGIDKPEQVKELRRLKCKLGQGFFFAKPMPPEELVQIVKGSLPYDPELNPSDTQTA
jgi:diguanylate cyclase (GGDEF)-like protein